MSTTPWFLKTLVLLLSLSVKAEEEEEVASAVIVGADKPPALAHRSSALLQENNDCLQGVSLPADFPVFAASSPWNTPIADNAALNPSSGSIIRTLRSVLWWTQWFQPQLSFNYREWTSPVFVIDAVNCPLQDVPTSNRDGVLHESVDPDGNGIAEGLPLPRDGIWADPQSDGHMVLVDPNLRVTWEFSRAQQQRDGSWRASVIDQWDLDGPGYRVPRSSTRAWYRSGARGSGSPYLAGLLRIEEVRAGVIPHALAVATPINRPNVVCSPPASRTDGQTWRIFDGLVMGARLQLDPQWDVSGLAPEAQLVARTLQTYGAYVADSAPTMVLYAQNLGTDGTAWLEFAGLDDVRRIPISAFRVLDCAPVPQ